MRNNFTIASVLFFLAEYCLRDEIKGMGMEGYGRVAEDTMFSFE